MVWENCQITGQNLTRDAGLRINSDMCIRTTNIVTPIMFTGDDETPLNFDFVYYVSFGDITFEISLAQRDR